MKQIFFTACLILIALFALSGRAQALLISQTLSTPNTRAAGSSPPLNSTLSFTQFNTRLAGGTIGVLNNVTITMHGVVVSDVSLKNTSAGLVTLTSNVTGNMCIKFLGAGTELFSISSGSWIYASKSNMASGTTYSVTKTGSATDSTTLSALTDASTLTTFTGAGVVNLLAYTELMLLSGISGGTDYVSSTQTWAQETVTIEYDYTDTGVPIPLSPTASAPEPGTILLLGTGLLGLGGSAFFRRRRKTPT